MFMRFHGGGVGHKTTRDATQSFYEDRDALDSVPFKKESERTGMFYVPRSPMNEDDASHHNADQDVDEDMQSCSTGRDSIDIDEDQEAAGQGDTDEGEEDEPEYVEEFEDCQSLEPVDQLNGEEDSDDEADEDIGSELEDECSEFGYGDLEERIIEDDVGDNDGDHGDGDSEIDLGAEDGEGAADNEEDYDDYGEY
ncbi:hypothetical protein DFH29DRAFT_1010923 [Suillus ampliporus]|nr:hypothetical protein DFH29DRAFT_1010923 [Suillus ampliporus]